MKLNIENMTGPANGVVYVQSNTHLLAFADRSKNANLKDEPQKLDIQLKK